MNLIKEKLKMIAEENMINEIRFIDAEALEPRELFENRQPKDLMPEAKSLIISSVYIGDFRLPEVDSEEYGRISRLTLSGFYWNVVEPLNTLRDYLISQGYKALIYDGLAEENCIPLKKAAIKAGLGWAGKNTLLINREYGSFQALGGIITDAELAEIYLIEESHCGNCTACIDSCPGKAIESPGLIRSKCLSNLLEEVNIPETVNEMPDNYFFECDICQDACPWNKKHLIQPLNTALGEEFTRNRELPELFRFDSLLNMDETTYKNKILPFLTGFDLSFELFQRNVRLAYNYRHKRD